MHQRFQVRLHIIRNEIIENVGKSQSCMVSKLRIICSGKSRLLRVRELEPRASAAVVEGFFGPLLYPQEQRYQPVSSCELIATDRRAAPGQTSATS